MSGKLSRVAPTPSDSFDSKRAAARLAPSPPASFDRKRAVSSRRLSDQLGVGAAFARKFPMYVLPVREALRVGSLPKHEEVKGQLVEWEEGMPPVLFVSQTWLRRAHPDDADGSKWALLHALLRRALAGRLLITPNWSSEKLYGSKKLQISSKRLQRDLADGYVWFDFFSVPQADAEAQSRAIGSIVSYVADATYFMVLAGAWADEDGAPRDLRSWLGRGWCRMEQVSNALSMTTKPLIVAQSPSDVQTYGPGGVSGRMWLFVPVGLAAFTVNSDREALGPILRDLIDARAAAALEAGSSEGMVAFRVLRASKSKLLQGTGIHVPEPQTLQEWMTGMRFTSAKDGASSGWTPLRFAVLAGRTDIASQVLDAGARVDVGLARGWNQWGMPKGTTALHLACYSRDDAEMVQLLLARGANPRRYAADITPFIYACCYADRHANFDALLAHDLTLSKQTHTSMGALPLAFAAMLGHATTLSRALEKYPEHVPMGTVGPGTPTNMCTGGVTQVGDVASLRVLLDAGCEHDLIGKCTHRKFRTICRVSDLYGLAEEEPALHICHHGFLHSSHGLACRRTHWQPRRPQPAARARGRRGVDQALTRNHSVTSGCIQRPRGDRPPTARGGVARRRTRQERADGRRLGQAARTRRTGCLSRTARARQLRKEHLVRHCCEASSSAA